MEKFLEKIRKKKNRLIVGIETGNRPGRLGAVIVEVSGYGNDTLIDLKGTHSMALPQELLNALKALEVADDFDSEDTAGINFLILHQIISLYQELFEKVDIDSGEVDIIGLKCMEIAGRIFPEDPSALSEMAGVAVASHFTILSGSEGTAVSVSEAILQSLVDGAMKKFGLDKESREAVCVAMLANESLCSDGKGQDPCERDSDGGNADLSGEFFFPA
ncbi:MAG: hypothetical protein JW814_00585 [Candidatus Krumholzibacteriota bacterium]|nr:hypothetical protein [Candidatus Krumholzibacteriota bacterium]